MSHSEPPPENKLAHALLPRTNEFASRFSTYTERGAALAIVAGLDTEMQKLLRLVMVNDNHVCPQAFSDQGTLGQFGSKVRVGYLFNIISEPAYRELRIINRIRNLFAHDADADDFSFQRIKDQTANLGIIKVAAQPGIR